MDKAKIKIIDIILQEISLINDRLSSIESKTDHKEPDYRFHKEHTRYFVTPSKFGKGTYVIEERHEVSIQNHEGLFSFERKEDAIYLQYRLNETLNKIASYEHKSCS